MVRGLYLAGTGMLIQRSRMDVITNNVTNMDTIGYKKDMLLSRSFEDMLISRMNDPSVVNQTREVGLLGPGVHIDEVMTDFAQGTPEQTSRSTDLCIIGDGFFVVNTPEGEMYTRAGNFTLDGNGFLVDVNGNQVMGVGGPIQLTNDNFLVNGQGEVYDLETDTLVGQLRIVEFADPQQLRKAGNNLFTGGQPQDAANSSVLQGYIEGSNVSIANEVVDMIITYRAYESSQQAVKMIDQTLDRAVNDIARA